MYKKIITLLISLVSINSYADTVTSNNEQAKVIIYRGNTHRFASSRDARLYLDNKHIANISKDDYIEFCTSPAQHKIISHLESALIYSNKNKKHFVNELSGGNTYLIRINDDENGSGELIITDNLNAQEQIKNKTRKLILPHENIVECKPFLSIAPPIANSNEEKNTLPEKNENTLKYPSSELVPEASAIPISEINIENTTTTSASTSSIKVTQ